MRTITSLVLASFVTLSTFSTRADPVDVECSRDIRVGFGRAMEFMFEDLVYADIESYYAARAFDTIREQQPLDFRSSTLFLRRATRAKKRMKEASQSFQNAGYLFGVYPGCLGGAYGSSNITRDYAFARRTITDFNEDPLHQRSSQIAQGL